MLVILRFFRRICVALFHGRVYDFFITHIPFFAPVYQTKYNQSPVRFKEFLKYSIHRKDKPYWPVHPTSTIRGNPLNVYVGIDAAPGISPCCYILAIGKIFIDDYAQIAPNVGILSGNHFMLDIRQDILGEVRIGKYARIGMGSIVHPGVILGDFTTVAAGSVVTTSFPDGYCVIAGNPAVIVKDYSKNPKIREKFLRYRNEYEYNGFIPHKDFDSFRTKYLNI